MKVQGMDCVMKVLKLLYYYKARLVVVVGYLLVKGVRVGYLLPGLTGITLDL